MMDKLLFSILALLLMSCGTNDQLINEPGDGMKVLGPGRSGYVTFLDTYGQNTLRYVAVDDNNKRWLADVLLSSYAITQLPTRAYVNYYLLDGHVEGFDSLTRVTTISPLNVKDAVVNPTDEQRQAMGDDSFEVTKIHMAENGKWIDVHFEVYVTSAAAGAVHEFGLAVYPTGYSAGETFAKSWSAIIHHKGMDVGYGSTRLQGAVSFRLPDQANPVLLKQSDLSIGYNTTYQGLKWLHLQL